MVDDAAPIDHVSERSPFGSLWRWYRPYLQGSWRQLSWVVAATVLALACQAAIPLQVDALLSAGLVDYSGLALLAVLLLVLVTAGFASQAGARDVANDSAFRLRIAVFGALLQAQALRRQGLVRSSVVSRHTSDVDNVSTAFEKSVAEGLPAVVRIAQSLILLTWLDWRAGLVMAVATAIFLITRRVVGARLLVADRERLDAGSQVGEAVDETITATRLIAGLHLERWVAGRFRERAERLRATTHRQGVTVTRLVSAAQIAGLIGLFSVVVFGLVVDRGSLATVAASLLYVEAVVRGLEALPGWIRSLQLAVVSRRRIDQIFVGRAEDLDDRSGVLIDVDDALAAGQTDRLIGLVTAPGLDDDDVLATLSTRGHPDPWRLALDGTRVRRPGVAPGVLHVPADAVAFNASVRDHLASAGESPDPREVDGLLVAVGLGHLLDDPERLDEALGPVGAGLTATDRQRLTLAIAMAAAPDLLLVGPLTSTWDADASAPVLAALRAAGQATVLSVRSADAAALMDQMLFVTPDASVLGTHEELLVSQPAYAALWQRRLHTDDVDLSALGLAGADEAELHARLVTERHSPGDVIYRQGDLADRVVFIVSGHAEMTHQDEIGQQRRVALLGPGNHCGDLRLSVGERRAETATAVDACVVRSLSRDVVAASTTGLLDRPVAERRIVTSLLRWGPATVDELGSRLPELPPRTISAALDVLARDGAAVEQDGVYAAVLRRAGRMGTDTLLDRLAGL